MKKKEFIKQFKSMAPFEVMEGETISGKPRQIKLYSESQLMILFDLLED